MAVSNIIRNFAIPKTDNSLIEGVLLFANASVLKPVNYILNRIGNNCSLSIQPLMMIIGTQTTIYSPSPFTFFNDTITQQIPLITSDISGTQTNTIGIITITHLTITIYASLQGESFNIDPVNLQGFQNSIMINFSV